MSWNFGISDAGLVKNIATERIADGGVKVDQIDGDAGVVEQMDNPGGLKKVMLGACMRL